MNEFRDAEERHEEPQATPPPFLERLRPPSPPPALRQRVLRAAEAELAVRDGSLTPHSLASRWVETIFRSRTVWLAWAAAFLLLVLSPPVPSSPVSTLSPPPPEATHPPGLEASTANWQATVDALKHGVKTGPTEAEIRQRQGRFGSAAPQRQGTR